MNLENVGIVARLDPNTSDIPMVFKGATIDQPELEKLRLVQDIVRLGRVPFYFYGQDHS